jgi:hypothetical protein
MWEVLAVDLALTLATTNRPAIGASLIPTVDRIESEMSEETERELAEGLQRRL